MEVMTDNKISTDELITLRNLALKNKYMTPQAKGAVGIIIFKIENELPLEEDEERFLNELMVFLNIHKTIKGSEQNEER